MKIVLITGASRGIGKATAKEFAQNGWKVIANYRNKINKNEFNSNVDFYKADITNQPEVDNMINYIKQKYGKIDCLVNNAGILFDRDFEDIQKAEFFKTIETNIFAPFYLSREISKIINNGGTIVNVSSTNGLKSVSPENLDYNISKVGMLSLTRDLASQLKPNIRVNAVAIGWADTDMIKYLDENYIENENKKIYLGRFAKPEEIANVIFFLASDKSSYINAEVITVDGGMFD